MLVVLKNRQGAVVPKPIPQPQHSAQFRYIVLTPETRRIPGKVAWDLGPSNLPAGWMFSLIHGNVNDPFIINDVVMPLPVTFYGSDDVLPPPVYTDIGIYSLERQRPYGLLLTPGSRIVPEQWGGIRWSLSG